MIDIDTNTNNLLLQGQFNWEKLFPKSALMTIYHLRGFLLFFFQFSRIIFVHSVSLANNDLGKGWNKFLP